MIWFVNAVAAVHTASNLVSIKMNQSGVSAMASQSKTEPFAIRLI
jgi:hypothetical protein